MNHNLVYAIQYALCKNAYAYSYKKEPLMGSRWP